MRTLTFVLFIFTLILLYILIIVNDESRNILTRDEFMKEIFNKRIDLSSTFDYENADFYHLNPASLCDTNNKNESFLFIGFVIISPHSFHKRQLIRNTWANKTLFSSKLRVVFIVGKSKDEEINAQIENEFNTNQDILQLKFIDSYFKITKKVMLGFKWIHARCSNVMYVLRINEDVFVNTFAMIHLFETEIRYKPRQIYGWLVKNFTTYVNRKENEKFYVSRDDYACGQYPDYPSG
jgi:hypothetical protein